MGLYDAAKRVVPLSLKVSLHKLIVTDFIECAAHGDSMHHVHLLRKPAE